MIGLLTLSPFYLLVLSKMIHWALVCLWGPIQQPEYGTADEYFVIFSLTGVCGLGTIVWALVAILDD